MRAVPSLTGSARRSASLGLANFLGVNTHTGHTWPTSNIRVYFSDYD